MSDGGVKNGADVGARGCPGANDLVVIDRGRGLIEVETVVFGLLFITLLLAVVFERNLVEQIELQ